MRPGPRKRTLVPGHPRGRYSRYTVEQIQAAVDYYCGTRAKAARALGLTSGAISKRLRKRPSE